MCCQGQDYVPLANVAQKLNAFHSFLGFLPSTATLQFLSPKRALRVHHLRLLLKFHEKLIADFLNRFFAEFFAEFGAVQKCAHLVKLENAAKTHTTCKFRFDTADNEPAKHL